MKRSKNSENVKEQPMNEDRTEVAMSIILNSGDARNSCMKAMKAISENDFDYAKQLIKEAKAKINLAHIAQTDAIQDECRGERQEYSLLFAHAQDTLMTIQSEIILVTSLLDTFESLSTRIRHLEERD